MAFSFLRLGFRLASQDITKRFSKLPAGAKQAFVASCLAGIMLTGGGCASMSLLNSRIEADSGSKVFSVGEIPSKLINCDLFDPSTRNFTEALLLEQATAKKVKLVSIPSTIYDKHFSEYGGANYRQDTNTVYMRAEERRSPAVVHEVTHSLQKKTNFYTNRITSLLQGMLLRETGAYAMQALVATQEFLNDNQKPILSLLAQPGSPDFLAVTALGEVLDKNPSFVEELKDRQRLPSSALMDEFMCKLMNNGTLQGHVMSYPPDLRKQYRWFPILDYRPGNFSPSDVAGYALGTLYPEGTRFPKTEAALKELGLNISPLLKKEFRSNANPLSSFVFKGKLGIP